MALGYAFSPTEAQAAEARSGQVSPPFGSQGSIRTLNYSLPKITGAAGISPLVSDQRQGSGISSAVLESVLRTVLGPDHANMILAPSPQPQGPVGGQGGGGSDSGLAALLASMTGGSGGGGTAPTAASRPTPPPAVHPGDDTTPRPTPDTPSMPSTREVITPPDEFVDRTGQQTAPRTPDFGGGNGGGGWQTSGSMPNARQDKYNWGNGY